MATKEKWSQIGYLTVTESAANTLTFAGLSVFSNVLGQKGMIIHRIQYVLDDSVVNAFSANADGFVFGLAGTDDNTSIYLYDPEIYDYNNVITLQGTFVGFTLFRNPVEKSYEYLPGGGLLVPADRLYIFAKGTGFGVAGKVSVRFYFTLVDLAAAEYLELAQSLRVLR